MKETAFTDKFIKEYMKPRWPYMWYRKIHGNEFQRDIPDFLFCINGAFVAIEFKVQRDGKVSTTRKQVRELNLIKNSKGSSFMIAWDENRHKIFVKKKRMDWRKIKTKYIRVDWDFEFNKYETCIDLIEVGLLGL